MLRLRLSVVLVLLAAATSMFAQDAAKKDTTKRHKLRKQAITLAKPMATSNGQVLAAGTYDLEVTNDSKRRMILVFSQDGVPMGETLAALRGFGRGVKVGLLCNEVVADKSQASILCNDHAAFICNGVHTAVTCNARETEFQCNAHKSKIQCNARDKKFQCDAHSAKIQCDAHNAQFQCNGRDAKIQCNAHSGKSSGHKAGIQCNDKTSIQCNLRNTDLQCNLRNAGLQCDLRNAGQVAAVQFTDLGFGKKSPVMFDAAKGTLSIIAATGDYAGRGSIEAMLLPVE